MYVSIHINMDTFIVDIKVFNMNLFSLILTLFKEQNFLISIYCNVSVFPSLFSVLFKKSLPIPKLER